MPMWEGGREGYRSSCRKQRNENLKTLKIDDSFNSRNSVARSVLECGGVAFQEGAVAGHCHACVVGQNITVCCLVERISLFLCKRRKRAALKAGL